MNQENQIEDPQSFPELSTVKVLKKRKVRSREQVRELSEDAVTLMRTDKISAYKAAKRVGLTFGQLSYYLKRKHPELSGAYTKNGAQDPIYRSHQTIVVEENKSAAPKTESVVFIQGPADTINKLLEVFGGTNRSSV